MEKLSKLDQSTAERGVPYGLPWRDAKFSVDGIGQRVEDALHNAGIWTYADLQKNPNVAIGALKSVLMLDYSRLVEFAEQSEK
jgi:predicted flap endonuclease-1-like 5' DNA nuclease